MAKKQENVRTDLALEAVEELQAETEGLPSGVIFDQYQAYPGVHVSDVSVSTQDAAQQMNKAPGRYITIESQGLMNRNRTIEDNISRTLSQSLSDLLPNLGENDTVLVVGLGNANATPDALGPRAINLLMVTRHLQSHVPEDLAQRLRPVAALAPGVLGTTGIETENIIQGVLNQIEASAVIVIDALAARQSRRVFSTFQLTDSGIHPGAGIGNDRPPINEATMGAPVIGVGIPTVVHAATIAGEALSTAAQKLDQRWTNVNFNDLNEALRPVLGDMIVTPKEVDVTVREAAQVLAKGLNSVLHPDWDEESIEELMA